jgi:hypothetical protein
LRSAFSTSTSSARTTGSSPRVSRAPRAARTVPSVACTRSSSASRSTSARVSRALARVGVVEQPFDQLVAARARLDDLVEHLARLRVQHLALPSPDELGEGGHGAQRLAQVVGHRAGEGRQRVVGTPQRHRGRLARDGVADAARKQRRVEAALDQEVLGAAPDGLQAGLLAAVDREHDDGRVRRLPEHGGQRVEALAVGQSEVEQHGVHVRRGQALAGLCGAPDRRGREARHRDLAEQARDLARVGLVVLDDQDLELLDGHCASATDGRLARRSQKASKAETTAR